MVRIFPYDVWGYNRAKRTNSGRITRTAPRAEGDEDDVRILTGAIETGAGDGDRTHGRHFGKVELYH